MVEFINPFDKPHRAEVPPVFSARNAGLTEAETSRDPATSRHILPIASGKGGVGKTFVAVNLGIHMARRKKKTVIVDLDIGGSNLHTYLGLRSGEWGIGTFLTEKHDNLNDFLTSSGHENLAIVQGDQLIPDLANLTKGQMEKLIQGVKGIEADVVILDLGAGSHSNVVDFFMLSGRGVMVAAPNHGSILNTFGFLKTCVYRLFRHRSEDPRVRRIVSSVRLMNQEGNFKTFWDVLNNIASLDRELAFDFKKAVDDFRPSIVFNQVENPADIDILAQLVDLIYQKLLLNIDILGYLPLDDATRWSVKERTPLAESAPSSKASKNLEKMAAKLADNLDFMKPLYDPTRHASSFEEIEESIVQDTFESARDEVYFEKNRKPISKGMA
ncbi:MAG: P-loop NTPase [Spirochaetia bacterium]|nr:P-loop NTPase [Spirochaetia bacterium]